jgi:hypothetical protein
MNAEKIKEYINAFYPNNQPPQLIEGFEEALIGFSQGPNGLIAIYSECLCAEIISFSKVEHQDDVYWYLDSILKKSLENMGTTRPLILEDIGFPRAGLEID